MFYVGLADQYGIPPSRFLKEWGSRDITLLRAYHHIQNRTARVRNTSIRSARPKEKTMKPKRQSPEQILKLIDNFK